MSRRENRFLFQLRERSSWPRITKLRNKCLLNGLQSLSGSFRSSDYSHTIHVRLLPFERTLLEQAFNALPNDGPLARDVVSTVQADHTALLLFFRWYWADTVLRLALAEFDPTWVDQGHAGDRSEAFDTYKTQLMTRARDDIYDRYYSRTEQLIADNPELLNDPSKVSDANVTISPHPDDVELWRMLGMYVFANLGETRNWPGFREVTEIIEATKDCVAADFAQVLQSAVAIRVTNTPESPPRTIPTGPDGEPLIHDTRIGNIRPDIPLEAKLEMIGRWANDTAKTIYEAGDLWDVWIFYRMIRAVANNRKFTDEFDRFIRSEAFSDHWRVVQRAREEDFSSSTLLPVREFGGPLSERPSEIAGDLFDDDLTEYLQIAYDKQYHDLPRLDPRLYLEFIPWTDLRDCLPDEISESLADLGLDVSIFAGASGKIWRAQVDYTTHTFYASDELYPPHITSSYCYPGLLKDGKVIYRCRNIHSTVFCKDLRHFWTLWNDCAITRSPYDGSFYLLETLPGIKARMLMEHPDIGAVFDFFGMKYRYRDTLSVQKEMLREILGPEYDPSYSDFLVFIKPEEFDLSQCSFVGSGSFGRVYRVPWKRKPIKNLDHVEEACGDVVLKIASTREGDKKFFKELKTVYAALAGNNTGCVAFHGFTKVFMDQSGQPFSSSAAATSCLVNALVFDYASEGSVINFLSRELEPGNMVQNWFTICNTLNEIAEGLSTIHKQGVVHRDLHPNNVLVSLYHNSDYDEGEFISVISDFGEAKDISKVVGTEGAPKQTLFTLEDYLAPEAANEGSSKESDIYAWAVLGVEIIRTNYSKLEDEDGQVYFPVKLVRVLESCLQHDPHHRFDAPSLCFILDEILNGPSGLGEGEGSDVEWYDENYDLPELQKRLSLPSRWLPMSS